jgi:YegS/Rv2252/BmrU family lipid kinase
MSKEVLMINNPMAGGRRQQGMVRKFVYILRQRGYKVNTFVIPPRIDPVSLAHSITPNTKRIIIAGGDGTINQVLNCLVEPGLIPLYLLPAGTANMLANELGLPHNPEAAVRVFEYGDIRRLDLGRADNRRFLGLLSVGLDAMVTREVLRSKKRIPGLYRYILPLLRAIARYHPPKIKAAVDTHQAFGYHLIVSNTRSYGTGLIFAHRASCDSGHLDICVFTKGSVPALLRYYFFALRGKVSQVSEVTYLTGSKVRIEADRPVPVQVDGDYFGTTPVEVTVLPSSVPVIVSK